MVKLVSAISLIIPPLDATKRLRIVRKDAIKTGLFVRGWPLVGQSQQAQNDKSF